VWIFSHFLKPVLSPLASASEMKRDCRNYKPPVLWNIDLVPMAKTLLEHLQRFNTWQGEV